jgi:hypothetical protein
MYWWKNGMAQVISYTVTVSIEPCHVVILSKSGVASGAISFFQEIVQCSMLISEKNQISLLKQSSYKAFLFLTIKNSIVMSNSMV